jgi:hypothetical protein
MRSRAPAYITLAIITALLLACMYFSVSYVRELHYRAKAGAAVYVWLNSKPTPESKPRIELLEELLNQQTEK